METKISKGRDGWEAQTAVELPDVTAAGNDGQ